MHLFWWYIEMTTPYGTNTHSPFASSLSVSQSFPVSYAGACLQSTVAQSGSPAKESGGYNPALLCRKGQETIQEILSKTTEVFQYLRTVQFPNGVNVNVQQFQDRKHKLDEPVRQLEVMFRKLRFIYDSVNESTANLPSQPVEVCFVAVVFAVSTLAVIWNHFTSAMLLWRQIQLRRRSVIYQNGGKRSGGNTTTNNVCSLSVKRTLILLTISVP